MQTIRGVRAILGLAWFAGAALLTAQTDMRGHWSGSIDTQAGPVAVEFDLDKTAAGWIGSAGIPLQNASGIPLEAISFGDGKGTFRLKGAPGDPTFTGTLSADGKTLEGQISQGPQTLPLKLSRTGDAKVEVPKPSPPVTAEFVGTWEGTINFGVPLRLTVTLSNGKNGAEAQLVSLDQDNATFAANAIAQTGKKLIFEVKVVGGGFEGEMSADGTQLNGTWTQLGNGTPLILKKGAAKQ